MQNSNSAIDTNQVNVATHLRRQASRQPYQRAVVYPWGRDQGGRVAYTHLTFRQLDMESDCLARGLEEAGIKRGTRTVLMVTPSIEFFTLTFALFKTGAIPVVVDPGMGIKRMVRCLEATRPRAFIGIPKAHMLRLVHGKYFKSIKTWITVGRRWAWGGLTLDQIRSKPWRPYPIKPTRRDETAAILFTTGSTGPAKGAIYTHGVFDAQVRRIGSHFDIKPGEIDLPTFPLFALFDPALGMTAVIPDMDPTKPAKANPKNIIEAIINHGVTNMFASPALLNRIGEYGSANGVQFPSLKRVVSAGAPVSPAIIDRFTNLLRKDVKIHTPYGATEAMPVASTDSSEILTKTRKLTEQGFGMCVGHPIEGVEVRIIKIMDESIGRWEESLVVAENDIGEITVCGDLVTRQYHDNTRADTLAKIKDGNRIWHRMGDLGWRDTKGRIWFCGRKSHRVITAEGDLYTIPCEAIFNNHPLVFRSALVGVGDPPNQTPVICIELEKNAIEKDEAEIEAELLELAGQSVPSQSIDTVLFHDAFPVDIRHNSKIFREQLAEWAEKKLG
jgi:olefin beta-lactone synthetase